ncbi:MAG: 5-deoxy-glucuronate isomerase [Actinomycetota bacterium]
MTSLLHHPAGSLATDGFDVHLTPERAGWGYSGLQVLTLGAGEQRSIVLDAVEAAVLPLSIEHLGVSIDGEPFTLEGRTSVFDRVSDFVYAPRNATITFTARTGGDVAVATSRCEQRLAARYGPAHDVPVDVFGAGPATRQRNAFLAPEAWPHADRLMCVELLTPDGNWSSYPPHRHDDSPECPVNNEEIYYFRIGATGSPGYSSDGFGLHRTYTPEGDIDEHVTVRDGDVFCVPRGYHGPCIAAPGYPMYYLNVLAGPSGERSMAFCDDPAHHWVRDTWSGMAVDPRVPMTDSNGRSTS